MTQGAPKNTRTAAKKTVEPGPGDEAFDLDAWLGQRDLLGRRLMKIGGEWFEFDRSATSDQLIAYNQTRGEKGMLIALGEFLTDPANKDGLGKAIDRQRQPMDQERQDAFLISIADFIIHGDAEYSAKASQDSKKPTTGESSAS
ncbi:hypothetical protein ACQPXB_35870 [Amycolatopsis sp. CA-161197]|uniref:hypothetical protein n=1 Tax=Amycolatopsis sp. CA-161197 TaxID=3239922 RepID=UPI003D8E7A17